MRLEIFVVVGPVEWQLLLLDVVFVVRERRDEVLILKKNEQLFVFRNGFGILH